MKLTNKEYEELFNDMFNLESFLHKGYINDSEYINIRCQISKKIDSYKGIKHKLLRLENILTQIYFDSDDKTTIQWISVARNIILDIAKEVN